MQTIEVPGSRGTILDRNGNELAVSEDAATVFATPYQVEDPPETAHKLAKILDVSQDDILESISDRSSGFAYVARKATSIRPTQIEKLDLPGIGSSRTAAASTRRASSRAR